MSFLLGCWAVFLGGGVPSLFWLCWLWSFVLSFVCFLVCLVFLCFFCCFFVEVVCVLLCAVVSCFLFFSSVSLLFGFCCWFSLWAFVC